MMRAANRASHFQVENSHQLQGAGAGSVYVFRGLQVRPNFDHVHASWLIFTCKAIQTILPVQQMTLNVPEWMMDRDLILWASKLMPDAQYA